MVRKLEEKERLLQGTISTAERELALRTQALDMNKRKVNICQFRELFALNDVKCVNNIKDIFVSRLRNLQHCRRR